MPSPFKSNRPQDMLELRKEFQEGCESFREKRDRALGRRGVDATTRAMFDRLDGLQATPGPFLASNGAARELLAGHMLRSFRILHDTQPGLEFAHVTIYNHAWTTSDENTYIDVAAIKSAVSPLLSEIAPNWSAVIEAQVFTNVPHNLGGKALSPHVHATLWGSLAHSAADRVRAQINGTWESTVPGGTPFRLEIVAPSFMDLARTVRYPLKAPNRCKTVYIHPRTKRVNVHASEAGDRFIRYLRVCQILSLIRQRDLMFAGGEGVAIQQDALRLTDDRRRQDGQGEHALKRKDVRKFWAEIMDRPDWRRFYPPTIICE